VLFFSFLSGNRGRKKAMLDMTAIEIEMWPSGHITGVRKVAAQNLGFGGYGYFVWPYGRPMIWRAIATDHYRAACATIKMCRRILAAGVWGNDSATREFLFWDF
jgi:hypothetical protein